MPVDAALLFVFLPHDTHNRHNHIVLHTAPTLFLRYFHGLAFFWCIPAARNKFAARAMAFLPTYFSKAQLRCWRKNRFSWQLLRSGRISGSFFIDALILIAMVVENSNAQDGNPSIFLPP